MLLDSDSKILSYSVSHNFSHSLLYSELEVAKTGQGQKAPTMVPCECYKK